MHTRDRYTPQFPKSLKFSNAQPWIDGRKSVDYSLAVTAFPLWD
jgi:hypothetical protein